MAGQTFIPTDQIAKAYRSKPRRSRRKLVWSIYQKFKSRRKVAQLTAQASGSPVSENHVNMLVASGQAPSVMTEPHVAPTLGPPPAAK